MSTIESMCIDPSVYSMGTKAFGVREDLQAEVRHEPNACGGWVLDLSLGCAHRCSYCLFSRLEQSVFRLGSPGYNGEVLPFHVDRFLAQETYPPIVYLSYSSDPLQPELAPTTARVLRRLVEKNVSVFLVSKGRFTPEVLATIAERPGQFSVQVGMASANVERNALIEPGVPTFAERLETLTQLAQIPGLRSLAVRMDPLLPGIDDDDSNLQQVLSSAAKAGAGQAVASYLIVTAQLRSELLKDPYLASSVERLTERVETISKRTLYSLPANEKHQRLAEINVICNSLGLKMSACGCKDEQLKRLSGINWVCHPYRDPKKASV